VADEPKRWVLVSMIHHAIQRTEAEIAELKAARLFVRDASGPEDSHAADTPQQPAPKVPVLTGTPAGDKPAS
jgi:hypothetical protein